jgi:protein-disulfide isomerase
VRKAKGGSRRTFTLLLLAVLVVGAGAIAWATQRRAAAPNQVLQMDPNAPASGAEGYLLGRPDAPVEIVEFADFECPACGQYATITGPDVKARLVDQGIARVRLYDFPINDQAHKNSLRASLAAACANDQQKFWPMHDKLFAGQNDWSSYATDNPTLYFQRYARELGLDMSAWQSCYDAGKYVSRISSHRAEATRRGVQSTPSFVIGDRLIPGAVPYDRLKAVVDTVRAAGGAAGGAAAGAAATGGDSAATKAASTGS